MPPHFVLVGLVSNRILESKNLKGTKLGVQKKKTYVKEKKLAPSYSPLLPIFFAYLIGMLLRLPTFSLICLISAWKRKGAAAIQAALAAA